MLEGAVMEYAKWLIAAIATMFVTMAAVYMYQLNEVNNFQQEVNYQIERHGGLTKEAYADLNKRAITTYGGCLSAKGSTSKGGDSASCLYNGDNGSDGFSGFFVCEAKDGDPSKGCRRDIRPTNKQARYGTPVKYIVTRQIGQVNGKSFINPVVVGTSSSRVRGTVEQ